MSPNRLSTNRWLEAGIMALAIAASPACKDQEPTTCDEVTDQIASAVHDCVGAKAGQNECDCKKRRNQKIVQLLGLKEKLCKNAPAEAK